MNDCPRELKYSETHEWVRVEGSSTIAIVGITEFAQAKLGDIVFVDGPETGVSVEAGEEVCVVESVKAAADIFTPVSGNIIAINQELEDAPAFINTDPYGDGWLYKIELSDKNEYDKLLTSEDYVEFVSEDDD